MTKINIRKICYGKQKPTHLPIDAYSFDSKLDMYVESNMYFRKRTKHYLQKKAKN